MLQQVTCGPSATGVNGVLIHVDVLDDSFFVNHEGGSVGNRELGIQNAVVRCDLAGEIAQQRKVNADLLGKGLVSRRTIDADAQDLRAVRFEFGDISLIRLKFLRSTTGEGQYVEG